MAAPKGNQHAVGFGRPEKYTEEFIEELTKKLDSWSQTHWALTLNRFFGDEGITDQRIAELCKKSHSFSEVLKIAKKRLASRREEGAMNGTLNPKMVMFTQPHYDRQVKKWILQQKKSEDKTTRVEITLKDPIKQISETIQVK